MPQAGFEPATPAKDRSQTLALDRSATGTDPRTVQLVASRQTDYANPATIRIKTGIER